MTTFQEQWGFPSEVLKTVPGATSYLVENTTLKFRTGRGIIHVVFYNQDRVEVARRSGMRLKSKAGKPYEVCQRDAPAPQHKCGDCSTLDSSDAFPSVPVHEAGASIQFRSGRVYG